MHSSDLIIGLEDIAWFYTSPLFDVLLARIHDPLNDIYHLNIIVPSRAAYTGAHYFLDKDNCIITDPDLGKSMKAVERSVHALSEATEHVIQAACDGRNYGSAFSLTYLSLSSIADACMGIGDLTPERAWFADYGTGLAVFGMTKQLLLHQVIIANALFSPATSGEFIENITPYPNRIMPDYAKCMGLNQIY